jgi:hypothetical protein
MGSYEVVDYNLTLCPLQSRLQHIYHRQPCARADRNQGSYWIGPRRATSALRSLSIK